MALSQLPVTSQFNQTFNVSLPIGNVNRNFQFFFYWNDEAEYWQFNLFDRDQDLKQILCGEPVYTIDWPYNNILSAYTYKDIGSLYVVNLSGTTESRPNSMQLGNDFLLIWGDTPVVQTVD